MTCKECNDFQKTDDEKVGICASHPENPIRFLIDECHCGTRWDGLERTPVVTNAEFTTDAPLYIAVKTLAPRPIVIGSFRTAEEMEDYARVSEDESVFIYQLRGDP